MTYKTKMRLAIVADVICWTALIYFIVDKFYL